MQLIEFENDLNKEFYIMIDVIGNDDCGNPLADCLNMNIIYKDNKFSGESYFTVWRNEFIQYINELKEILRELDGLSSSINNECNITDFNNQNNFLKFKIDCNRINLEASLVHPDIYFSLRFNMIIDRVFICNLINFFHAELPENLNK